MIFTQAAFLWNFPPVRHIISCKEIVKGGFVLESVDKKYLSDLFVRCLYAKYFTVERGGSFALEREGERLYIYFEKSHGAEDWQNNFDFFVSQHGRECPRDCEVWYAHGGFLRVWQSVLPYIEGVLLDLDIREIVTVGYSHGAALALLCHEYIWFNRPDIRGSIYGYGFGCPRVIWGRVPRERERWGSFYRIKNYDDVVTHLPPSALGFRHVGRQITVGGAGLYSRVDAHREENYIKELTR